MLQLVCNELGVSVVTGVIMCIMRCECCNWCNKVYNELGMCCNWCNNVYNELGVCVVTGVIKCIMS